MASAERIFDWGKRVDFDDVDIDDSHFRSPGTSPLARREQPAIIEADASLGRLSRDAEETYRRITSTARLGGVVIFPERLQATASTTADILAEVTDIIESPDSFGVLPQAVWGAKIEDAEVKGGVL